MEHTLKVLFVATVEIHILTFHLPYLKYFCDMGYEVHVACAGDSHIPYCHVKHNIPFERNPFKKGNIKSFFALKRIIDKNDYRIVHCHTPVGGVIGRLAASGARKKGTKVLYTAHGFQFYKGGPVKDWIVYYTTEKIMARFTDVLITVNKEDYNTAVRKKFRAGVIKKINGIGIEADRFRRCSEKDAQNIKKSVGLHENDFMILCVGELNDNKNQEFLLGAVKSLCLEHKSRMPKPEGQMKLVLAGPDSLNGLLDKKANEIGVSKCVVFLGYRNDIPRLLAAADICISSSKREGLPINILEAMAAGKPVVATDIRGHRDLIRHEVNGFLVKKGDYEKFAEAIKKLYYDGDMRSSFGKKGAIISRNFSLDRVMEQMKEIYVTELES